MHTAKQLIIEQIKMQKEFKKMKQRRLQVIYDERLILGKEIENINVVIEELEKKAK